MTVERFFLDGYRDETAYEALKASPTFPLVRELEFKFGLKIIRYDTMYPDGRRDMCQMGHKNGLSVCKVWTAQNREGQLEYFYRSPFFLKDRGESREDKETLHSVKMSALMATLTRRKVVPSMDDLTRGNTRHLRNAVELMKKSIGSSSKQFLFTQDELHAILLMALGKSPSNDWVKVDQNKCQETLDKCEAADKVRKTKREEVDRVFRNPFYMIGVDTRGDYLIGKFKLSNSHPQGSEAMWETVESFKRYRSYEQVPELIPLMTMVKVAHENSQYRKAGVLPVTDIYDEGLDTVFFYNTSPTDYDCAWMVTPCI